MKPAICLLTAIFFACPALADAVDEVRCREIQFSQSVENKDIDAFASFIDPDARFFGSSVLRGTSDITKGWSVFFADDGPEIVWRPRFVEVLKVGDLALSRGPFRMRSMNQDGELIETWGIFNSVWRKSAEHGWQVIFDAGSATSEPPSVADKELLQQDVACP